MKYYLVALFDDESYKNLNPIQRNLSRKFRANRNSPIPYIPLEIIENPNVEKLNILVDKILKPYKNFKIELTPKVKLCDNNKTLNLEIEQVGYIKRLNRLVSTTLNLHGFNLKGFNAESDMNLTLANMNYINKDSKKGDNNLEINSSLSTLKVNRIELWKISNNRRETLIQTFPLRSI